MNRTFLQLVTKLQPSNGIEFCQYYLNESVWGTGLLMVTAVCLSSVTGILLLPFLSPAIYRRTLTLFVAVGVGTLSGSAFFNLLPEAFDLVVVPDHLEKAWAALTGIYLFYVVDKLLNISVAMQKKSRISPEVHLEMNSDHSSKDRKTVDDDRQSVDSGHSHTAAIAWLVIFGDGLHNFIDGVSIGAAFEESILNGVSVGVAVLFEEALIFNLLSSTTCFLGFVIGVIAGNMSRYIGQYIFGLAAGMFLYISLSGMLSEMNRTVNNELQRDMTRAIETITLQAVGLTAGVVLMYIFARYGYLIQFQ